MATVKKYSLGLDFGTNSVRALIVELSKGKEVADCAWNYRHGKDGVITSPGNPHLARQGQA
ncbi:hypothetical protein B9J78_00075 [bacterium Unc6]|nr:hypothetical protein [bacterium Unc6]